MLISDQILANCAQHILCTDDSIRETAALASQP